MDKLHQNYRKLKTKMTAKLRLIIAQSLRDVTRASDKKLDVMLTCYLMKVGSWFALLTFQFSGCAAEQLKGS